MTQATDKPMTTLKYDTDVNAYETIIHIESRTFKDREVATEFSIATIGKGLYEMDDSEMKKYAQFLIENVQGTNEGNFDNTKFEE